MMKLVFAFASALLLKSASAQDDAAPSPKARSLTLQEFMAIAATAVETDFEYSEIAANQSAAYWDAAIAYEWTKNLAGENATGDRYPFILCNMAPNMTCYQRRIMLAESFPSSDDLNHTKVIYNGDEGMCEMAHILPSEAINVEGDDFIVQPHMASMKMIAGTLTSFQEELGAINAGEKNDFIKIINVVICPGVQVEANNIAVFEQEWTDNITSILVSEMYPSEMAENYYFTSQAYLESDLTTTMNQTETSIFWRDIRDRYQKDQACNDVFENRLIYSVSTFGDAPWVEIKYNTTGVTEHDVGCVLLLTLALSGLSTVCAVEIAKPPKPLNVNAQGVIQSGEEGTKPFFDVGLDGSGQVVAVSDTGIDNDNCYFWDVNHERSETINFDSRKVVQYIEFENGDDYYLGHGTHVAGTIAGKRSDDGETESNGAADGIAPGAKLAFADIGDKLGMIYIPTYEELLATGSPYAQIHSMSWGVDINLYTTETKIFDDFMFNNDEFLIVVAAGNIGEGNAYNTVGEPATGKNIIAVGSHHNGGGSAPEDSEGVYYASGFSSRGPTKDGRQKPDVLAPGHYILSAGALPNEVGECDPAFGTVEPGGTQDGLLSMEGTSMAAPALAGAAAIVRQYFNDGYYPSGKQNDQDIIENPSSALIKGIILNGAQYLQGVQNEFKGLSPVEPYDETQNFGRISLKDSLYIAGKTDVQLQIFDREEIGDQETKTYDFQIDKSQGCTNPKFSVTLIWNEPGSIPGCMRCLLNNLDLTVIKDGNTYFPNGLKRPDSLNNNERVVMEDVNDREEFKVVVNAKSISKKSQTYSLIATGCFGGVAINSGDLSESEKFANEIENTDPEVGGKQAGVTTKNSGGLTKASAVIGMFSIILNAVVSFFAS